MRSFQFLRPMSVVCATLFAWLALAAPTRPLEPQVRDDGGFFSAQTVDQANAIIRQIKRDHGKDVMVETFSTIPDDMKSRYDPARRDQFFEEWLTQRAKE